MQLRIARDTGIVDQHIDRAEIGFDLFDARRASLERGHIPFVDRDAGFGLEFLRRLVVAAVIGGDLIACGLERFGDCRADAAGSLPLRLRRAFASFLSSRQRVVAHP